MPAEPHDSGGIEHPTAMDGHSVLLTLPSDDDGPRAVDLRHRLRDWLSNQSVSTSRQEDIVLGTYEAIANAVEHGYRSSVAAGAVTVTVTVHDTHIDAVVADQGRWRPPPADPGYRGRGFALIEALSEHWTIDHGTTGTTVTIRFARD